MLQPGTEVSQQDAELCTRSAAQAPLVSQCWVPTSARSSAPAPSYLVSPLQLWRVRSAGAPLARALLGCARPATRRGCVTGLATHVPSRPWDSGGVRQLGHRSLLDDVLWNPETAKLDGVSAPPKCTASAPGHGYLDVPPGTTPEALQRTPANPLLILLEAKCLAGLLPHPKGKGPREALQPVIAGMVLQRQHDILSRHRERLCSVVA